MPAAGGRQCLDGSVQMSRSGWRSLYAWPAAAAAGRHGPQAEGHLVVPGGRPAWPVPAVGPGLR